MEQVLQSSSLPLKVHIFGKMLSLFSSVSSYPRSNHMRFLLLVSLATYLTLWLRLSSSSSSGEVLMNEERLLMMVHPSSVLPLPTSYPSLQYDPSFVQTYHLEMKNARSGEIHGRQGPIRLGTLGDENYKKFGAFNMYLYKGKMKMNYGIGKGQVPELAQPFMTYIDSREGWSREWSSELIETLIEHAARNEDISAPDYPKSALQIYQALDRIQTLHLGKELNILVAGAISPWIEACILSRSGLKLYKNRVATTDYNEIRINSTKIEFQSMLHLKASPPTPLFDVVISYSSLEHDGLGRYGDPINPEGDFAAMQEYRALLKDDGLAVIAVPMVFRKGDMGQLPANWHRVYSFERMERLCQGFESIGEPITVNNGHHAWQNQPIHVLRKTKVLS
jgi:hypothetical protein